MVRESCCDGARLTGPVQPPSVYTLEPLRLTEVIWMVFVPAFAMVTVWRESVEVAWVPKLTEYGATEMVWVGVLEFTRVAPQAYDESVRMSRSNSYGILRLEIPNEASLCVHSRVALRDRIGSDERCGDELAAFHSRGTRPGVSGSGQIPVGCKLKLRLNFQQSNWSGVSRVLSEPLRYSLFCAATLWL